MHQWPPSWDVGSRIEEAIREVLLYAQCIWKLRKLFGHCERKNGFCMGRRANVCGNVCVHMTNVWRLACVGCPCTYSCRWWRWSSIRKHWSKQLGILVTCITTTFGWSGRRRSRRQNLNWTVNWTTSRTLFLLFPQPFDAISSVLPYFSSLKSFLPSSVALFNSLPISVVSCSSKRSFCKLLISYFLPDKFSYGLL